MTVCARGRRPPSRHHGSSALDHASHCNQVPWGSLLASTFSPSIEVEWVEVDAGPPDDFRDVVGQRYRP